MSISEPVTIIGGGLAGCEAAWQLLTRRIPVRLYEMKPRSFSPAHTSPLLAELVCSNSLRSNVLHNAAGLLKEEMRRLNSLIMDAANAAAVPAGKALAVDRTLFSRFIEKRLKSFDTFEIIHEEIETIPTNATVIIATGPLTSLKLAQSIISITGNQYLYFYDAISPIVTSESINTEKVFRASRYATGDTAEGDYLNCPFNEDEFNRFWHELTNGHEVPLKDFEDKKCFEGCLPIEVLARRGNKTLLFGPMKPVGLTDPKTRKQPYAVLQLRQENRHSTLFNLVGFQTKLTWPEQKRIFRLIPGLEHAEFARFGSIHRNTFLNSPAMLQKTLQLSSRSNIFFAGQITGVEGYIESTAIGLISGINAYYCLKGSTVSAPPSTTAVGALLHHIINTDYKHFQPMNINFGLFEPIRQKVAKKVRGEYYAQRALTDLEKWKDELR